ncbi:hypothetical protein DPX16_21538 [Anabarilius grahami]|uniref:Uncharacterized protein n=1 Tax=Anabarilius grahami TaxID=495550 RepID=A0A3N0XV29_ANAGA|nr:hypothetical protein DPX16_21538 [Anabarilius grahami]
MESFGDVDSTDQTLPGLSCGCLRKLKRVAFGGRIPSHSDSMMPIGDFLEQRLFAYIWSICSRAPSGVQYETDMFSGK